MSEYFPKPKSLGEREEVTTQNIELDLSNSPIKTDLKNVTGIDTLSFAKKVDLSNLKSHIDNLDIDKLKNIPTNLNFLKSKVDKLDVDRLVPPPGDLSKLSDVVKMMLKKYVFNTRIKNIEDKIPDVTNLATKTTLNVKISEAKSEIPSITNLGTQTALNSAENKIPSVSNLVKKVTITQKLKKLNRKLLIMITAINILVLQN